MKKLTFCICGFLLIMGILISNLTFGGFRIFFLDVGQGDSIFIRTPDDYTVLIDGGPGPKALDELGRIMPVYSRTIDIVVLSHPHADHVNGLVEIVKRYDVKRALIVGSQYNNAYYKKLLELFQNKKIPVVYADASRDIKVGSYMYIDIIWPGKNAHKNNTNINNASLSMRVITPQKIFMLTGDAETEQEEEILKYKLDLSADIFKAGHHGSRTASSEEFLNEVKPETAVIQSGKDNSYKHPHAEALERLFRRGIKIRRNDLEGRVDFIF